MDSQLKKEEKKGKESKAQWHEQWGKMHVIDIPSRKDLKWKTITWEFNSCKIQWDSTGKMIIVIFNKVKSKNKSSTVIQVAELSPQNIAIEEHEFDDVKCVNIDDNRKKLAVVSLDPSNKDVQSGTIRYNVEIFRIESDLKGKFLHKIGTLADKILSHVAWAPNGIFFALVNTDKFSANIGFLEFAFIKGANSLEITKSTRVAYMMQASWDPAGRCLATVDKEGHYTIWAGTGEVL